MSNLKIALVLSAVTALAACGGGGNEVADAGYNYKQHDGAYSCKVDGDVNPPLIYNFAFSEKSVVVSGGALSQESVTFDDKVGFIGGKPYYSETLPNADMPVSQTIYFKNNRLEIMIGLTANVPDKLSDGPVSALPCTKV